jgi:cytochrome P450
VELVKKILVKDSQYFIDRIVSFNEKLDPLMSRTLLTITGQRWRHLRTNLTPVFTSSKHLCTPAVKDWVTAWTKPLLTVSYSKAEGSTSYFFEREMEFTECKVYKR